MKCSGRAEQTGGTTENTMEKHKQANFAMMREHLLIVEITTLLDQESNILDSGLKRVTSLLEAGAMIMF